MSAPVAVTPRLLRRRPLPTAEGGDKEMRGRLLVIAGSDEVPGAALLTGEAALAAGAGKTMLAVPTACAVALGIAMPEARVEALPSRPSSGLLDRRNAIVIGPGMDDKPARLWTEAALGREMEATLLLDAAAMKLLWSSRGMRKRRELGKAGQCIITPHAGELAGLSGMSKDEIAHDPVAAAKRATEHLGAIVVLKGVRTIIAGPDHQLFQHEAIIPGLAASGSGDVLAGIIGGLLARGTSAVDACLWGVFMHAQAGQRLAASVGTIGYRARDLAREIPAIMDRLG